MCHVKNSRGFTLIELLIVIVIIGILSAVAIPMYTRYITNAKAVEAVLVLNTINSYLKSYNRAHITSNGWPPRNWPQQTCDTTTLNGEWIDELVETQTEYFEFHYVFGDTCGDCDNDGDTDMDDVNTALSARNTCEGDPDYVASADLDGDHCVTVLDARKIIVCGYADANVYIYATGKKAPFSDSDRLSLYLVKATGKDIYTSNTWEATGKLEDIKPQI